MFRRMFLFIPDHKYLLMVSCQMLESLKELLSVPGSAPWTNFSLTFDHSPEFFFFFTIWRISSATCSYVRGGEEEVKIFIDTHIHLVQIYTRVLNTEQGWRKHKWALLFLRLPKSDVRGKRIYSPQLTYLSSSLFALGIRTGTVSAELITTSKALPLHKTSRLQKAEVSHAPEWQMSALNRRFGNSGWDACFPNRAGTPACPVVAAACQGQPRPCQRCCLKATTPNPSGRVCTHVHRAAAFLALQHQTQLRSLAAIAH